MKSFKLSFLLLIALLVLLFGWSASLPNQLSINEFRSCKQPIESLYKYISEPQVYQQWFPWQDSETEFKINNDTIKWEHSEHGKGYFFIREKSLNKQIVAELKYAENDPPLISKIRLIEKQTGEVEINWHLESDENYSYPIGRIKAFLIGKMSRQNIKKGLDQLISASANNN